MPVYPPRHARPIRHEALIAAVVASVVAASAPAQLQFEELRKRGLPTRDDTSNTVAFADVDGDGDLDLAFGNKGQNRLYLNDGAGGFADATAARLPTDGDSTMTVAVGDVDGDGDVDLVFGTGGYRVLGQNRLYLNDGTGRFADATAGRLPAHREDTRTVVLGDVDGDGDLDLLEGNYYYRYPTRLPNRLYLNDGTGTFIETSPPGVNGYTYGMALGDADGDGDLDVVSANHGFLFFTVNSSIYYGGQNWLHLNDGSGHFANVAATHLPQRTDMTSAVAMGDVDGDGDLDLVFGNQTDGASFYYTGEPNHLYLNDGSGRYADASTTHLPPDRDATTSVALFDADGDGDLDMLLGSAGEPGTRDRLYFNDGSGVFSDVSATRLPEGCPATFAVAVGDVDGDGDLDASLACHGQNRLYLNDGSGAFADATAEPLPADCDVTQAIASGDVDGDGDVDLVFGNVGFTNWWGQVSPAQNRLLLNNGTGAFEDVTATSLPAVHDGTVALVLGDVDGDRDLDLVIGNWAQNRLYLNDGSGTFTDATAGRLPGVPGYGTALDLTLADVDRDRDLDLVLGVYNGQVRLYLNDGTGHYNDATAARMRTPAGPTTAVAAGDVDGDGDLDLVVGSYGAQNRLYLNDGSGTYTDATAQLFPRDLDGTLAVALGDVDGDGDLDLVFGNYGGIFTYFNAQNRLYLNDGSGTFTDATSARLPSVTDGTYAVALGDLDGDGDLDLVVGNHYFRTNQLYLNDGTGAYSAATSRLPAGRFTTDIALADVDRDGDLDVTFANYWHTNRIYLNLQRQLHTPWVSRTGGTFTLEAYARYGHPALADIVLPVLATGTASIPLPRLGTLGLDPTTMVAAAPFLVPQPAGVGSVSFPVPAVPSLVGAPLYAQALLVPYPYQAHLTNVTGDVFIR